MRLCVLCGEITPPKKNHSFRPARSSPEEQAGRFVSGTSQKSGVKTREV
ncbi:MAG: hypothetical protein LUE99_15025 [Bacteroides sp.]|nr:hypothetical protein [Bacteroides sp.]